MDLLIKGMTAPENCASCIIAHRCNHKIYEIEDRPYNCPMMEIHKHGNLVDVDELLQNLYDEAFNADIDNAKWNSGLWIRYRLVEHLIETAKTVIEAN